MTPIDPVRILVAVVLVASAACATPQAGHIRFHNQPPVTEVNDRRDVPKIPEERKRYKNITNFDVVFHKRLTRWMEMRPVTRARDVNSIDEAPNSTWFTNRIGERDMSADDIRRGPNVTGTPEAHLPFVVKSSKGAGMALGIVVEDQRGKKYILKFDLKQFPEIESGADAVSHRLLWASGYHVPENYVVKFRREDLVLSKKSKIVDSRGRKEPMTEAFLDQMLSLVHTDKDGMIRGLASQFLEGIPVGGHSRDGVRDDDPNDRIPHQQRRVLRGAYVLFSWLDLTDMKEDQTLDMYVEDPADPKVHYLMHHMVDFGKSLGAQAHTSRNRALGRAHVLDPRDISISLLTLGLWRRPWEDRKWTQGITGVGVFESETFHPGEWKANTPNYFPFLDVDRFDGFWGAKIMMRFTPEHIRAAAEQGRYSDPRAVEYITRVLLERQRKAAAHWFSEVAPLDRFAVQATDRGDQLCFDDLGIRHGLAGKSASETIYRYRAFDVKGRRLAWAHEKASGLDGGRTCAIRLPVAPDADGYTIVRIETSRQGQQLPAVFVHVARDPATRALRVIGLRRH
ncbi:MAG: hypothetical protein M4D80_12895 [Myxococcota bacterium]|nr:hypothetical protein [Deltaproteobacteria bacterium]MDQ3336059.1 hypothetical protein [Myxococcota bacterium]